MDRCSQVSNEINESNQNLTVIKQLSKTSSPFNDNHLRISKISQSIENSIKSLEKQISIIETQELKKDYLNNFQIKILVNTLDTLKMRLEELSIKHMKFLKSQGETIRNTEKRREKLENNEKKKKRNVENLYSTLPDLDPEENTGFKETVQSYAKKENTYYQERSTAVHQIEKLMGEMSTMFNRISMMIHRQGETIERIDNDTEISLTNVKLAENEVLKLKDDMKSNRKLLVKVFLIIIVFVVVYILFT